MPQPLCTGSILQCSMGLTPSVFVADPLPGAPMVLGAMPAATIIQTLPNNIPPFGMCKSMANPAVAAATSAAMGTLTPMPCTPLVVAPWMPPATSTLSNMLPVATVSSRCVCAFGGSISVTPRCPARPRPRDEGRRRVVTTWNESGKDKWYSVYVPHGAGTVSTNESYFPARQPRRDGRGGLPQRAQDELRGRSRAARGPGGLRQHAERRHRLLHRGRPRPVHQRAERHARPQRLVHRPRARQAGRRRGQRGHVVDHDRGPDLPDVPPAREASQRD